MSFWEKALGTNAAPPPRQAVPVTPVYQSEPWFRQTDIPTPSAVQPSPSPVTEEPEVPLKAHSARLTERCPDCGSGNFFKPQGNPNAMPQCYNCGWNPRFAHSTAGAGMPSGDGSPVTPARQVSTANNFNPKTIVGRIS